MIRRVSISVKLAWLPVESSKYTYDTNPFLVSKTQDDMIHAFVENLKDRLNVVAE
jgi:hypothetical protein